MFDILILVMLRSLAVELAMQYQFFCMRQLVHGE